MTNFDETMKQRMPDQKPSVEKPEGKLATEVKAEGKMSPKEKRAFCHEKTNAACLEVISTMERMRAFLRTLSRFEKNSIGNALLIYSQRPEATKLKEYSKWEEEGKHIRKGAKAVMILEPTTYKDKNGAERNGFNVKSVFDITDLTSEEKVPFISYDCKAVITAMVENSKVHLETTSEYPKDRETGAYYDIRRKTIVVEKSADKDNVFAAVAKALAHAELSKDTESYRFSDNEFTARCVAYTLVCKYGFSTDRVNISSIPAELAGLDEKEIKARLSKIHACVREISDRTRNELEKQKDNTERSKSEYERR